MRQSATLLTCLVCSLAIAGVARADTYTGASGGNYNDPSNWSGLVVPADPCAAYIRNGATVTLDAPVAAVAKEVWVGGPSDPSGVNGSALHILPGAVLTVTNGSLVVAQQFDGSVYQSGGSVALPYFRMSENGGGDSTYTLAGGSLIMDPILRPGGAGAWTMDMGRGGGTAKFVQTGGYVKLINNSYWNLGFANTADSMGEFTMTNGSIDISGQAFNIGRCLAGYISQGAFTMSGGELVVRYKLQIGYAGTGVFNQSGGLVSHISDQPILLGETQDPNGRGVGIYNMSGGSAYLGGNKGLRVGSKSSDTLGIGTGLFNMTGGTVTIPAVLSVGTKGGQGTFLCSNGLVSVETGLILADAVQTTSTVPSNGFMRISGGSVQAGAGGVAIGRNGPGRLEVTSGTLLTSGAITLGYTDATYGSGTGELKVGANAYVSPDGGLTVNTSGAKLEMEIVSATKNSRISTPGSVDLGSNLAALAVDSPGYRPREGDKFTLLTAPTTMTGSFSAITSNITLGLPGGTAFTGAIVSGSQNYVVTFVGLTAGDANGDHAVNGGDLALMGGAWGLTGQSWATGDFNGDGKVDGGDLALSGGSWNWSKPVAPEAPLPEPATLALLALGALTVTRRRR